MSDTKPTILIPFNPTNELYVTEAMAHTLTESLTKALPQYNVIVIYGMSGSAVIIPSARKDA